MAPFPKSLTFELVTPAGKPGTDVALFLQLKAPEKNDYWYGPELTDNRGFLRVSRESLETAIRRSKEDSPMDYASSLDECRLTVLLESPDELLAGIDEFRQYYPNEAERLAAIVARCSNANYVPTSWDLAPRRRIQLEIRPRKK